MPKDNLNQRLILPPIHRAAYSDRTAWILACCSSLAYKDGLALKSGLAKFDLKLVKRFTCDQKENAAYLAVHQTYAVLAFQGTVPTKFKTIETDADFWFVQSKYGDIHQGFLDAYKKLSKQIEPALRKIKVPIYITGHSLGGALALLASIFLKDQKLLAACYNYGCPRVGNEQFADLLFKVPVYRCVHHVDIVPGVPFMVMGYRQYGDVRYLSDDNKVCEGSQAVWHRGWAYVNLSNWGSLISDHSIEKYIHILHEFAMARN
jgi:triacylglycerol lipase